MNPFIERSSTVQSCAGPSRNSHGRCQSFRRSAAAENNAPFAAIVVVPPAMVAVAPAAVASPVAPAAAIEPAPVVAAARVPPITGTVAITAVDAAATLEMAEAIAGSRNNITFSPFKLNRSEMSS